MNRICFRVRGARPCAPYHKSKFGYMTSCRFATRGGTGILPVIPMDRLEACPTKRPGHPAPMITASVARFQRRSEV